MNESNKTPLPIIKFILQKISGIIDIFCNMKNEKLLPKISN